MIVQYAKFIKKEIKAQIIMQQTIIGNASIKIDSIDPIKFTEIRLLIITIDDTIKITNSNLPKNPILEFITV